GIGGEAKPGGQTTPFALDTGAKNVAAILPSASLTVLADKMLQVRASDKVATLTDATNTVASTEDSSAAVGSGVPVLTNTGGGEQIAGPTATLSAHSPQFADELVDQVGRVRVLGRGGAPEQVRVTLEPEDLGTIDLRLRVDSQNQVHLLITTETEAARDLLHQQMPQLRESLARHDMGFGDVTVQVGDQQAGTQGGAAQWGQQGQAQEGGIGRGADPVVVSEQPEPPRGVVSAAEGVVNIMV
ncbi:MAG: flagellar hook-length control protein FliK, partial [Magnetococcales bacterium]|nr:flagellar hook-length control protein FliK [Magnetococcales bacterium]